LTFAQRTDASSRAKTRTDGDACAAWKRLFVEVRAFSAVLGRRDEV